ncbi:MAG: serine O-acetyltransferase EpsC [Mesonia hippocampi]|uniref:serine O-acetyltransferase EpsC n=1 Tax=Mesonia hippocampi TaxID=1628250 RepID=UPI003F96FFAA
MSKTIFEKNKKWSCCLPAKQNTEKWIEQFFYWFYGIDETHITYANFKKEEEELKKQLFEILASVTGKEQAKQEAYRFFEKLPSLHDILEEDLEVVYNFDPAAQSRSEILLSYPGFFAVTFYRIAHWLWKQEIPVIPRLISEYVHSKTGIDIHPGAQIGKKFFIDHGTGIVIGETTIIGDDVKLYQGVTLGALSVAKHLAKQKRHPSIGNHVTIYANATILGGETKIGDHSIIGGNVWLTNSLPSYTVVYHKSEVIVKDNAPFPPPINFVI